MEKEWLTGTPNAITLILVSALAGFWLGGGFTSPPPKPLGYSMVHIGEGAVAVMKNETGELTFYGIAEGKMIEIPNPATAEAREMFKRAAHNP